MCGRYIQEAEIDEIIKRYKNIRIDPTLDKGNIKKSELFPNNFVPIVILDDEVKLEIGKWGFKTNFTKSAVINARGETVFEKKLFSNCVKYRRCLIPATSFFEWKNEGNMKSKYIISLRNMNIFSMGGIYTFDLDSDGNKIINTIIITTRANQQMNEIHERMPLIINEEIELNWLSNKSDLDFIKKVIEPTHSILELKRV